MGRARSLVVLIGVLAALACLPGVAAASPGTFTWDLTSDFTTTTPGANPDKDIYGRTPWSYDVGGDGGTFSPSFNGGLAGWAAASGFVAMNPTGNAITNGTATYPAGEAVLAPSTNAAATITWTSPVNGTVNVSGSVVADQPSSVLPLCPNANWTLMDGTDTAISQAATSTPAPYSTQLSVTVGEKIALQVSVPQFPLGTPDCAETSATLAITQVVPAPAVTLTSPANGATIADAQPTFSGAADTGFQVQGTVTVRVYSGSDTAGTLVQTLPATVSGGGYSVAPAPALPDGTYTAQAEQDTGPDTAPLARGFSAAHTFTLTTTPATVTLNSPGAAPLSTATPTVTGTAAHSEPVTISVYPGSSVAGTPVGTATGTSAADGTFSIQLPSLPDGEYTAQAKDVGGHSDPVTFRIKVHAPALTLTQPATGGYLSQAGPVFLGGAGSSLGDAQQVALTLYGGSSTAAKNLGTQRVTQAGGSWTLGWPQRLALGTYTVRVSQSDDAGHTATVTHTFTIVPANSSVGATVDISPTGQASVPMWCIAPVGRSCSGTVLILTRQTYRTAGGGLAGRLRVMFAYVTIPGGGSVVVRRQVQSDALRTLRRARKVPVVVVAALKSGGGSPRGVGVSRVVTVRSARHR